MEDTSPLRVVVIGGGNGLSSLLQGPEAATRRPADPAAPRLDITAVVTVTDDGGSSGRLRREFDVLPPGDIRNCMVALSEDSALLSRLFQYRFAAGRGLKGHSFGNLFLMALTQIMGDFPEAVRASSEVLKIAGRIYPSTAANVALEATLADGTRVVGETRISRSRQQIRRIRLIPRAARPLAATLSAIAEADVITLGPGSLFTSVVPNLLVEGIPAAIARSRAVKAYFVNLMWQPGETTGFRASDHVRAIHHHAAPEVPGLRRGEHPAHSLRHEEALRPAGGPAGGKRRGGHLQNGRQGDGREPGPAQGESPARSRRHRRRGGEAGAGRPPPRRTNCHDANRMRTPVTVVILAAGLGTRMKSRKAKVLHRAGGKALVEHVVETALELAPPERIFVVVGHQADEVRQAVDDAGHRLHRADGAEGHRPRADGVPRGAGRAGRLPGDRVWRRPAAARRDPRALVAADRAAGRRRRAALGRDGTIPPAMAA